MKYVNFTSHEINIANEDRSAIVVTLLPDPRGPARVREIQAIGPARSGVENEVDVFYTGVSGLPDPEDGVVYVVSLLTALRAAQDGRYDVCAPAPTFPMGDGRTACRGLKRIHVGEV